MMTDGYKNMWKYISRRQSSAAFFNRMQRAIPLPTFFVIGATIAPVGMPSELLLRNYSAPSDATEARVVVLSARPLPLLPADPTQLAVAEVLERRMGPHRAWRNAWHIVRMAERWELEEYVGVVARQILVESGGNPRAVSSVGALGLLQVMPNLWTGVFPECGPDLFDEATNIRCGMRILRFFLQDSQWNLTLALNRYSGYHWYDMEASPYVQKVVAS